MDSKAGSAIAAMTFSAAIWGFIGMYTRNLASEGFTAMQTAFLRMLIGAVILAVLLAVAAVKWLRGRGREDKGDGGTGGEDRRGL